VHKISIIPRGIGALGYTIQRPSEDRYLTTRTELENRMTVLLGGRAAEQLVLGEVSSGAADDLAKATDIALDMVTRLGMVQALGQVAYERQRTPFLTQGPNTERAYSEDTARQIDEAVKALIDTAYNRACAALQTHRTVLEKGAKLLLERETLTEADLAPLAKETLTLPAVP
jgi:cell division protease FtsH